MTGSLEPPLHHVSMRWFSEGLFERSREVRWASLRYSTETPDVDIAVYILFDKCAHTRYLPARQRSRPGAVSARVTFNFRLQNG